MSQNTLLLWAWLLSPMVVYAMAVGRAIRGVTAIICAICMLVIVARPLLSPLDAGDNSTAVIGVFFTPLYALAALGFFAIIQRGVDAAWRTIDEGP